MKSLHVLRIWIFSLALLSNHASAQWGDFTYPPLGTPNVTVALVSNGNCRLSCSYDIDLNEFERAGSDDAAIASNSAAIAVLLDRTADIANIRERTEEIAVLRERVDQLEDTLAKALACLAALDFERPEKGFPFRIALGVGSYAERTAIAASLTSANGQRDYAVGLSGTGSHQVIKSSIGVSLSDGRFAIPLLQNALSNAPPWYTGFTDQTFVDEWLNTVRENVSP